MTRRVLGVIVMLLTLLWPLIAAAEGPEATPQATASAQTPTPQGHAGGAPAATSAATLDVEVALMGKPALDNLMVNAGAKPPRRVASELAPEASQLPAAELSSKNASDLKEAFPRLASVEVLLSESLAMAEGSREVKLVGFRLRADSAIVAPPATSAGSASAEASADVPAGPSEGEAAVQWYVKVALELIDVKERLVLLEAEALPFVGGGKGVSGAGVFVLGKEGAIAAVLELPEARDPAAGQALLILVSQPAPGEGGVGQTAAAKHEAEAELLMRRLDIKLESVPLYEALAEVRKAAGEDLSLMVDPTLAPEIGRLRVGLDSKGMSLEEALGKLLSRAGLGFDLDGKLIFVSTPEKLHDVEVRAYPRIGQLMFEAKNVDPDWKERLRVKSQPTKEGQEIELYRFTPELLMGYIAEHVEPDSWKFKGGRGTMEYSEALGVLIVRQTAKVQTKLAQLLEMLTPKDESPTPFAVAPPKEDKTR